MLTPAFHKTDLKIVVRDEGSHYVIVKGLIPKYRKFLNSCTSNFGQPNFIKLIPLDIKGEIDFNPITVDAIQFE